MIYSKQKGFIESKTLIKVIGKDVALEDFELIKELGKGSFGRV